MIDPSLIKEFAIGDAILAAQKERYQPSSEKEGAAGHVAGGHVAGGHVAGGHVAGGHVSGDDGVMEGEKGMKIRDIQVDQNWVERAKMFADYFFQIVSPEEVDRQFRSSEFDDFQLFLDLNSLHYFEDHYLKVKTETEILKGSVVENCYEKAKVLDPKLTLDGFLEMQGILMSNGTYLRAKTKFPKTKLLEILTKLKMAEMSDSEGLLTVDLLDQLFQSKETSLKMILGCFLTNLGAMMTSDGKVVVAENTTNNGGHSVQQHLRGSPLAVSYYWQSRVTFSSPRRAVSFANYPIGLILNRDYLKILEEWTQMAINHLVESASKSKSKQ